jgi:hypothetical protein
MRVEEQPSGQYSIESITHIDYDHPYHQFLLLYFLDIGVEGSSQINGCPARGSTALVSGKRLMIEGLEGQLTTYQAVEIHSKAG